MAGWALDLGTTNSGIARCDDTGQPQLVELRAISRAPEQEDALEAPRMVPSAVHVLEKPGLAGRLGGWPPLARRLFLGRRALIGRLALERNRDVAHTSFGPTYTAALAPEPPRPLARAGRRALSARRIAWLFLQELLAETKRATGTRIRDLVVTSPVSAFETYRAELQRQLLDLGVKRVRFVDEPVAAALGYGLSLTYDRRVLVVDIGGGTMHVVLVGLTPKGAMGGEARVIGKEGRPLGGNAVDGWLLEAACAKAGLPPLDADGDETTRYWRRLMLAEACRVKEDLHLNETSVFRVTPPGAARRGARGAADALHPTTRAELVSVLETNGFYRALEACLEAMFEDGHVKTEDVDDVLVVGGSTLLPGVFSRLDERFTRRRLRAWQPFEAVAYGGACFAADRIGALDFIVHDYAFVTHDPKTGAAQHTVVVPRGTRFPTRFDLWKRQLVPTCSLGEPEQVFRLVICEVERGGAAERRFVWDAAGELRKVGGTDGKAEVIVPLNAASPTLGYLDPPHAPGDRRPRLEIAFGVNAERWLVATVHDLQTRRELMREEPVVRLV